MVTFKKLMEYLSDRGVDFRKSTPAGYDNEAHEFRGLAAGKTKNKQGYAPITPEPSLK